MGAGVLNQYFGPHSQKIGVIVRTWSAREHQGNLGIDAEVFISEADAFAVHGIARQPGQTQAGFDAGVSQIFGASWYAARSPLWRELTFIQCRSGNVYP